MHLLCGTRRTTTRARRSDPHEQTDTLVCTLQQRTGHALVMHTCHRCIPRHACVQPHSKRACASSATTRATAATARRGKRGTRTDTRAGPAPEHLERRCHRHQRVDEPRSRRERDYEQRDKGGPIHLQTSNRITSKQNKCKQTWNQYPIRQMRSLRTRSPARRICGRVLAPWRRLTRARICGTRNT